MTDQPLPSIEDCREFLRLVNVGRTASGREQLEYLEFDGCEPGGARQCLSATNLFCVGPDHKVYRSTTFTDQRVASALGMLSNRIPWAIRVVTDPFDAEAPGLRQRMVDAGVVRP